MTGRKVTPSEAGDQTKERILAAAERLFSHGGFDGISLREIGRAAGVPFALITYHFQTKRALYRAVFKRRELFITHIRLDRLRSIQMTGDPRHDIYQIAEAVVDPLTEMQELPGGIDFTRLIAREVSDPMESERGVVAEFLDPVALFAISMLQKAVPGAPYKKVCWAFYLATGALAITNTNFARLKRLSPKQLQKSSSKDIKNNLRRFVATGWIGMLISNRISAKDIPL